MATFTVVKDPDAILPHTISWYLYLDGATISTSTWTVTANNGESPISLSVSDPQITDYTESSPIVVDQETTVTFTGGTPGATYNVKNQALDSNGFTYERTIKVIVWDK